MKGSTMHACYYWDFFFLTVQWLMIKATTTTTWTINSKETIVSELRKPNVFHTEVSWVFTDDDTCPNVTSQIIALWSKLNPAPNIDVNVSPAISSFEQQFINV